MVVYLIIVAELIVLYCVFWYLYIYEPNPRRVRGNPWGRYGERGFTTSGIDPTLPFSAQPDMSACEANDSLDHKPALYTLPPWVTGASLAQEFRQAAESLPRQAPASGQAERASRARKVRRLQRRHIAPTTCAHCQQSVAVAVPRPLFLRIFQAVARRLAGLNVRSL